MVADERSDNEGDQAVGADDQAVVCSCGALHFSKPRKKIKRLSLFGIIRHPNLQLTFTPWVEGRKETNSEG